MTFNTTAKTPETIKDIEGVLNLVINGWPSIHVDKDIDSILNLQVLNLVINGWPSIQKRLIMLKRDWYY